MSLLFDTKFLNSRHLPLDVLSGNGQLEFEASNQGECHRLQSIPQERQTVSLLIIILH